MSDNIAALQKELDLVFEDKSNKSDRIVMLCKLGLKMFQELRDDSEREYSSRLRSGSVVFLQAFRFHERIVICFTETIGIKGNQVDLHEEDFHEIIGVLSQGNGIEVIRNMYSVAT